MENFKLKLNTLYRWENLSSLKSKVEIPKEPFEFCDSKRKVGIEVEVENITRSVLFNKSIWYVAEDGSLRNHGIEFISLPIAGHEITYAVQNLFKALPLNADFSDRTSIHVHVNVRDFTCENLFSLLLLYTIFEKLLYNFAGVERYDNIFCVPLRETRIPIMISDFFIHGSIKDAVSVWQKYSGLNLTPLKNLGTVEYRQMRGHNDVKKILNWINILLKLHKFAKTNRYENIFNEVRILNTSSMYKEFVALVFGRCKNLLIGETIKGDMERGVSIAKEIRPPSEFLLDLVNKMHNKSSLLTTLGIPADYKKTLKRVDTNRILIDDPTVAFVPITLEEAENRGLFRSQLASTD